MALLLFAAIAVLTSGFCNVRGATNDNASMVVVERHVLASGFEAQVATPVDANLDGNMDIVSQANCAGSLFCLVWHEGDGEGNFTRHVVDSTSLTGFIGCAIGVDMDMDSDVDFVICSGYADDLILWFENDGSMAFTKHVVTSEYNYPIDADVADVDGDGDNDVVAAILGSSSIVWLENDGSMNFESHTIITSANGVRNLQAGDLDNDNDPDVVYVSYDDDTVAWLENSNGTFSEHELSTSLDKAHAIGVGDINGDGELDVVAGGKTDDVAVWFRNNGAAQSFTQHVLGASSHGWARYEGIMDVVDFDSDGDSDVLVANFETVEFFDNNGSQSFTVHGYYTSPHTNEVNYADFNNDGVFDVVANAQNLSHSIVWLEMALTASTPTPTPINFPTSPSPTPTKVAGDEDSCGHDNSECTTCRVFTAAAVVGHGCMLAWAAVQALSG